MNPALIEFYSERPCRICDKPVCCRHRELEADMAELEAMANSLTRYRNLVLIYNRDIRENAQARLTA